MLNGFRAVFDLCWSGPNSQTCKNFVNSAQGGPALLYQIEYTEVAISTLIALQDTTIAGQGNASDVRGLLNDCRQAVDQLSQHLSAYRRWREQWHGLSVPSIHCKCYGPTCRVGMQCFSRAMADPATGKQLCAQQTAMMKRGAKTKVKDKVAQCLKVHKEGVRHGLDNQAREIQVLREALGKLSYLMLPQGQKGAVSCETGADGFLKGLHGISDKNECVAAGKELLKDVPKFWQDSWPYWPKGCSYHRNGVLLWNEHPTGKWAWETEPICKVM